MKELKCTVYFHLYKIIEKENKLIVNWSCKTSDQWLSEEWERERIRGSDCKKSKKTLGGDGYVSYIDGGGGYMDEYMCSDLINYTF